MDRSIHDRRLARALYLLVAIAFVTGGSAQISGWDDTMVQLLAVPVLAWALWRLAALPASPLRWLALAGAAMVALVPLLQLLPIPAFLWHMPDARQLLADDLAVFGVVPEFRWSLAPAETERALLFLLPPLAAFAATLAVGPTAHRRLLTLVMALAMGSLFLGFAQLGVPEESVLNPYPEWAALFNGVFANRNHQGISLVLATIIGLAGALAALPHARDGLRQAWTPWVLGFIALFALCAIPLTGSRGAVLIAVFAVAAVPTALGQFNRAHLRGSWGARVGLVTCLALVALGLWATVGWMQVEAVDEVRPALRAATFSLGFAHAPLGTGVGAFVPAFEQGAGDALLLRQYVNHAHNEYLQWWMEGGVLAVLVAAAVAAILAVLAAAALRVRGPDRVPGVVALLCLGALLLHSWVDYPMRTVSLATVAAVLAGILAARAARDEPGMPAIGGEPGDRHNS